MFTSHHYLFPFVRMPFVLKNDPGTFQRAIYVILSSVRWHRALVYLDDVVIFQMTAENQIEHGPSVLFLLQSAAVTLKLKNCVLFSGTMGYLGHIFHSGKLEVAEHSHKEI